MASGTRSVSLSNIPQGWYMTWSMATQAARNICVTLADSAQTYVSNVCQQSTQFKVMSQGYAQVQGTSLTLTITENVEQSAMKVLTYPVTIALSDGSNVGQGYNIVLEDADDHDYNDLFVNVMAWQTQG
jgi:riboflavin synthase alpha subunit